MARTLRMALDVALISIEKVRPLIASVWGSAKNFVGNTPVKPLVHNPVVERVENVLDNLTDTVVSKISILRDKQIPGEIRYLEKELEKSRRRMENRDQGDRAEQGDQGNKQFPFASKTLKPELAIAWQYCKIECAPPMTVAFFAGSGGAKLEQAVGGMVNNFIRALESQIKSIDDNEARVKREKEEKIKAEQERVKAEELKKRQEASKKAEEAKKSKEKEAAAKQAEAEKKAATAKKEEPKKAEAKKPDDKKKPPAKKPPEAKKKPPEKKK